MNTNKVSFSRFEVYHRYSWVAPVNGFQTMIEYKTAKKIVKLENLIKIIKMESQK